MFKLLRLRLLVLWVLLLHRVGTPRLLLLLLLLMLRWSLRLQFVGIGGRTALLEGVELRRDGLPALLQRRLYVRVLFLAGRTGVGGAAELVLRRRRRVLGTDPGARDGILLQGGRHDGPRAPAADRNAAVVRHGAEGAGRAAALVVVAGLRGRRRRRARIVRVVIIIAAATVRGQQLVRTGRHGCATRTGIAVHLIRRCRGHRRRVFVQHLLLLLQLLLVQLLLLLILLLHCVSVASQLDLVRGLS